MDGIHDWVTKPFHPFFLQPGEHAALTPGQSGNSLLFLAMLKLPMGLNNKKAQEWTRTIPFWERSAGSVVPTGDSSQADCRCLSLSLCFLASTYTPRLHFLMLPEAVCLLWPLWETIFFFSLLQVTLKDHFVKMELNRFFHFWTVFLINDNTVLFRILWGEDLDMFKGRAINSHSVSPESGKGFLIVKTNTLKLLGSAVLFSIVLNLNATPMGLDSFPDCLSGNLSRKTHHLAFL